jgi:hypothetical protein
MTKSDYYRNLAKKRMGSGMLFFNAWISMPLRERGPGSIVCPRSKVWKIADVNP